jgi:hypothetical protein
MYLIWYYLQPQCYSAASALDVHAVGCTAFEQLPMFSVLQFLPWLGPSHPFAFSFSLISHHRTTMFLLRSEVDFEKDP